MNAKHVPAPWVVCENPPNEYWAKGVTIGSGNPDDARRICDLSPHGSDEVREANGRLICAAPELLEACQLFLKYASTDEDRSIQMMLNYVAALEASKAAIAKATGSQS